MRWYSVKKYKPVLDQCVIVRRLGKQGCIIDSFSQARFDGSRWVFRSIDDDAQRHLFDVTHFAIIEPVEIEE